MVASEIRKASAISAVVSPPSVRRVSATRAWAQRRVTAGEDQAQAVIGQLVVELLVQLSLFGASRSRPSSTSFFTSRVRAPEAIDRLVAGDPGYPGAGILRRPVAGPALERHHEGLLHRLLGGVEVAEDADEARDRPPRLVPEQAVDCLTRSLYDLAGVAPASAGSS
jgi:hypothetical protein